MCHIWPTYDVANNVTYVWYCHKTPFDLPMMLPISAVATMMKKMIVQTTFLHTGIWKGSTSAPWMIIMMMTMIMTMMIIVMNHLMMIIVLQNGFTFAPWIIMKMVAEIRLLGMSIKALLRKTCNKKFCVLIVCTILFVWSSSQFGREAQTYNRLNTRELKTNFSRNKPETSNKLNTQELKTYFPAKQMWNKHQTKYSRT